MFASLAALALAATAPSPPPTATDSTVHRRIVREFEPVLVVGGRRQDPGSIESVQTLTTAAVRELPVDRFVDAIALQAGVVAIGEDLHVRGGRTGELTVSVLGVPLNEPRRGAALELPLFAVRSADLLSGGLDADHAGSLAGELDVQTEVPAAKPAALLRWTSDARTGSGFDAIHARGSQPLAHTGLGVVGAAEARFDDLGLPSLRSRGREHVLGQSFGWRQDNRLLGWAKLAPLEAPQRASLEVFASRVLREPFDPMFSFDGWVTFTDNPMMGVPPLIVGDHPYDASSIRYRAADHRVMSEERRLAAIASFTGTNPGRPLRATLGWMRSSDLTSVGLRHDANYITAVNRPVWGPYDYAGADPFHSYYGDDPYFRESGSTRWLARADAACAPARGHRLRFGTGISYDEVRLHEVDAAAPTVLGIDSLRAYHAFAPGGFAWAQHRWESGGLVWNAGLRLQAFTAGPQVDGARMHWSWSPRVGFAYPVSDRDAFSLAYSRIFQDPPRDLLYDNRRFGYDRHPIGNGALEPSEMISWQAAIRHILDPTWSLQVGVFYRDVYGQPGTRNVPIYPGIFRLQYESTDDAHASGVEVTLLRELPRRQRIEVSYTFLVAAGSQSNLEGLAYGTSLGERPLPTGDHSLDWDERHALAVSAMLRSEHDWTLSWSTRVATGLPWTPVRRTPGQTSEWPPAYADQSAINSRRLPWNENTNVAVRFSPRPLHGARVLLMVTNVFDNRTERLTTLSGLPNPVINTLYDEYAAYRTDTGTGGGAFWNDSNRDGTREWNPVHDPRLDNPARALRFGLEVGY